MKLVNLIRFCELGIVDSLCTTLKKLLKLRVVFIVMFLNYEWRFFGYKLKSTYVCVYILIFFKQQKGFFFEHQEDGSG